MSALIWAWMSLGCLTASLDTGNCPTGGTALTYDNFGEGFFATWCLQCHGGGQGVSYHAFTTVEAIRSNADRIYVNATPDPAAMPPGPYDPPLADREKLAEWLECGAP